MTSGNGKTNGRRLKGALIGYGFIAALGHAPAYLDRQDVDIVAVADVSDARRREVRRLLPRARVYPSAQTFFASGNHVDFVDIAVPPSEHAGIAAEAMSRGMHVLCEKPLATSVAEAGMLLDRAVSTGRVLFPCHNYRFAPVITAIRDVLTSGRIGAVRTVTLDTFRPTHAKGVPEWNPDWRRHRRWSGGGIAMDHGSHSFYLAFEWLNGWPTAVTAKAVNQDPVRWDTEDNYTATLTFPESRLAHVHLTWTAGTRAVMYTLQGDRGAIIVHDDDIKVLTVPDGTLASRPGTIWTAEKRSVSSDWMDASHTKWFSAMFDRFVEAIELHDFTPPDTLDAYRCIEVIEASYASSAAGCREVPLGTAGPTGVRPGAPTPADVVAPIALA